MSTLANNTYITSSAIDLGAAIPLDLMLEVVADPNGTPTGNNFQVVVFAKFSLDNTNWTTGPESGTTTTLEPQLHFVGVLPLPDTTEARKMMSLSATGIVARYVKLIAKNETGVALTSGYIYTAAITGASA